MFVYMLSSSNNQSVVLKIVVNKSKLADLTIGIFRLNKHLIYQSDISLLNLVLVLRKSEYEKIFSHGNRAGSLSIPYRVGESLAFT